MLPIVAPCAARIKAKPLRGALRAALTRAAQGAVEWLAGAGKRACFAEQGNEDG